jgi:hypothetical protein
VLVLETVCETGVVIGLMMRNIFMEGVNFYAGGAKMEQIMFPQKNEKIDSF